MFLHTILHTNVCYQWVQKQPKFSKFLKNAKNFNSKTGLESVLVTESKTVLDSVTKTDSKTGFRFEFG